MFTASTHVSNPLLFHNLPYDSFKDLAPIAPLYLAVPVIPHLQRSVFASKHALGGLVKALALEFGPAGVRVNAIAPGPTDTEFLRAHVAEVNENVDAAVGRRSSAACRWGGSYSRRISPTPRCFSARRRRSRSRGIP
jgi:NAD(P)-dependent dehydrogenase (short-subunit alcohol dehydrogenase family)